MDSALGYKFSVVKTVRLKVIRYVCIKSVESDVLLNKLNYGHLRTQYIGR